MLPTNYLFTNNVFMYIQDLALNSPQGLIYCHHHHVVPQARISLTLSRHFSLSFIASGRSSGRHPVSSHSCWMYVRAGRPAFPRPYVGVHKSTSLTSSSLLLQQCPACLVHCKSQLTIRLHEVKNLEHSGVSCWIRQPTQNLGLNR